MPSAVIITQAEKLNYTHNYVTLPYDYGRPTYFKRRDVTAIQKAVYESLDILEEKTGFKKFFANRKVLVKPNLVGVMRAACYSCGYDIPQTTDPRVFDAVISYLKQLTDAIIIAESGGLNTRGFFKETGYDRIAKYYGAQLIAFEEQPLDKYYVPKAEVQKEVFIPRIISEVIRGEMLYVSVPKMKTNLYTEVTLGFKNAMGILPSNMRYRNHTWQIEKKLTDLLYLFKPDLTIIDAIIAGEGLTPGPIDPVAMDTIISGNNSVEVDRVATRMMGFDPDKNRLMIEAVKRGFGDPQVQVFGEQKIVPFRRADASLLSDRFKKHWPNVKLYVGHTNSRAPEVKDIHAVSPETVLQIEQSCRGGCLATLCMCMEMFHKSKRPKTQLKLAVVLGNGVEVNGKRYWFNAEGAPFDVESLKALKDKKFCVGECTNPAAEACDIVARGCGNVQLLTKKIMQATGIILPLLSPDNEDLPLIIAGFIKTYFITRKIVKQGDITDIPADACSDEVMNLPVLSADDMRKDWIAVPMHFSPTQIRQNLKRIKLFPL